MAGTNQIEIGRIEPSTVAIARPAVRRVKARLVLVATFAIAALGAAAFGIFTLAASSPTQTGGEAALVRAAEASAARLNAQAEAYAAAAAIDAYGARWAALTPSISPAAIEAYGNRWEARARVAPVHPISPEAIDAYGARWAALASTKLAG